MRRSTQVNRALPCSRLQSQHDGMRNLFLILLLVGLAAPAVAQYKGRVIGGAPVAFDGGTLLVTPKSAPSVRLRLWGVETSEMQGAPWAHQARDELGDFLDWSRRVPCCASGFQYCTARSYCPRLNAWPPRSR